MARRGTMRAARWRVVAVYDPDGTGSDFGYTVGLADHGVPELHMWARPTDGSDPGADFRLSSRDIGSILDQHASMLADGEIGPGSTFTLDWDEGLSHGHFTVGEPVDPDALDAYEVRRGAQVIPLRWELDRVPMGTAAPVAPEVEAMIVAQATRWRCIVAELGGAFDVHPAIVDITQRFGPWTPVIEPMREAIAIVAAAGNASWLIDDLADHRAQIGAAMAIASQLARREGRTPAFDAAVEVGLADGAKLLTLQDHLFDERSPTELDGLLPHARAALAGILSAAFGLTTVREHLGPDRECLVAGAVEALCIEFA